jgi:hypothetical protein
MLFGPQAGRKGGVAPALLTSSPAYEFWAFLLTFRLSIGELDSGGIENRPESVAENRLPDGSLPNCESAARSLFVPLGIGPGKP